MRKLTLSFLIILLISIDHRSNGQICFEKFYAPYSNQDHSAYSIVPSWKSGYILTGTVSPSSGPHSVLIMKIDSSGFMVWSKRYGSDYSAWGACIQKTTDSCYIISGEIGDPWYGYILKINENGDTIWTRKYEINYSYTLANSIYPMADGQFVLCGFASYPGSGGYWVLQKLNSIGHSVWYKLNGDPYYLNTANSIDHTSDDGYIVSGSQSWHLGDSTKTFLAKSDSQGNVIWTKYFPDHYVSRSASYAVKQTADGGFILGGEMNKGGILIKTNSNGDTIWSRNVLPDYPNSVVNSIQVNPDSSMVCCGTCYDESWYSSAFLVKFDKSGGNLWTHVYSQGYRQGNDCRTTTDEGYIIAGQSSDSVYVIKTDGNSMITGFNDQGSNPKSTVRVYPNPNRGDFQVVPEREYQIVEIVDPLLRTIYKASLKMRSGVTFRISLPDPTPGIYFLHLIQPGRESVTAKLIIE
jgi:hypothetical protein